MKQVKIPYSPATPSKSAKASPMSGSEGVALPSASSSSAAKQISTSKIKQSVALEPSPASTYGETAASDSSPVTPFGTGQHGKSFPPCSLLIDTYTCPRRRVFCNLATSHLRPPSSSVRLSSQPLTVGSAYNLTHYLFGSRCLEPSHLCMILLLHRHLVLLPLPLDAPPLDHSTWRLLCRPTVVSSVDDDTLHSRLSVSSSFWSSLCSHPVVLLQLFLLLLSWLLGILRASLFETTPLLVFPG